MQELRFVAVSEDGSYAVLAVPGRSARFVLPIDEKLRAVAQGQTSRLAQYEIEVESPLRPKEIQARIRAGETAEEIADAAGIPVERVRWFEGPVLAERAYIAQQAQTAVVRRLGDSAGPGPRLGDVVTERLSAVGADPEEGQWDSRKRGDGSWQVQLTYSSAGRLHIAEWVFDPRRRHVMPEDDNAARLSLPESELPPEPETMPGEATVTPIASRLGAAAGMGNGPVPPVGGSRLRTERPAPERPVPHERSGPRDRPERPSAGDRRPPSERPAYAQPPATPSSFRDKSDFLDTERPVPPPPAPARPFSGQPSGAPWRVSPPPEFLDEPAADDGYGDEYAGGDGGGYRDEARHRGDQDYRDTQSYRDERDGREGYEDREQRAGSESRNGRREWVPAREPDFVYEPEPAFEFEPEPVDPGPVPEPVSATTAPEAPASVPTVPEQSVSESAVPEPAAAVPAQAAEGETPEGEASPAAEAEAAAAVSESGSAAETEDRPAAAATGSSPEAESGAAPEDDADNAGEGTGATTEPAAPAAKKAPAAKTSKEPAKPAAKPAARGSAARSAGAKAPAANAPAVKSPVGKPPAAAAPVREEPAAEVAAEEQEQEQDQEQSKRPRPGKKNPRNRRSSVPSWDEIMLGSSRQRE